MTQATKKAIFEVLKAKYDIRNRQPLYSEICGHLVKKDIHRHCGCMA